MAATLEPRSRSLAKAVSWRITGTLAGSIAAAEMITKMLLYYLHERLWSRVGRPGK
jgi:uncharacterized membrane protein